MDECAVLGVDVTSGEQVTIQEMERRQGLYIIGKTGMGKTALFDHLVDHDMQAGAGLCVLDPHGDLVDALLTRIPPEREQDVILIDLADSQYPFGLNLFECKDRSDRNLVSRVATQAVEIFEKLWGETSWGPQLAQILRNCAYTLIENPGFTLVDMRRLLLDAPFRARLVANVTNPQVREFWEVEYNPLRLQDQLQLVRSTLNKVDEFLTPTIYPIVGMGETTVGLREAMDEGSILLVRLSLGDVGSAAVSLVGAMLVDQIFNAALSRRDLDPSDRRSFYVYADEYNRFATPAFAELLAEARKYGLAPILAHQFRDQLKDDANRGATLNAANTVVFAVGGEDADELAKQFRREPPVPDIAGYHPKLAIHQDPIGHLQRSSHEDAKVRELFSSDIMPLVGAAGRSGNTIVGRDDYWISPSSAAAGLSLLNRYFVDLMEHRIEIASAGESLRLSQIMIELRGFIGFSPDVTRYSDERAAVDRDTQIALTRYLEHSQIDSDQEKHHQAQDELYQARKRVAPRWVRPDKLDDHVLREINAAHFWAYSIRRIGGILIEKPTLTNTGQQDPYFNSPRGYKDVEAQISSELVSLARHTAKYRVLSDKGTLEGTMRTPSFRAANRGQDIEEREERVRATSRSRCCVPLADALARIVRRQSGPGEDGGGETTRRSPIH